MEDNDQKRDEGERRNEHASKQTSKQVQEHITLTYIPSLSSPVGGY